MIRHKIILCSFIFALFSPAPAVLAQDECGPGPNVTCPADADHSGTGVTYESGVDFSLDTAGDLDVGAPGMGITGTGNATLTVDTSAGTVNGSGGINLGNASGAITLTTGATEGPVTIDSSGGAISATIGGGDADLIINRAGSGVTTVDTTGGTGSAVVTHTSGGTVGGLNAAIGSGGLTYDLTGTITSGSSNPALTLNGSALNVTGGEFTLNLDVTQNITSGSNRRISQLPVLNGPVDLSNVSDSLEINIGEDNRWNATGTSTLSPGDSAVNIQEGGWLHSFLVAGGLGTNPPAAPTTDVIDFGDGGGDPNNVLSNQGTIVVGGLQSTGPSAIPTFWRFNHQAELRLENLGRLENAGDIYLGAFGFRDNRADLPPGDISGIGITSTDNWHDDILSLEGATYNGLPGSRIFMDVSLNATQQSGCDAALRDPDSGALPAADCLNIKNGATEGQTGVVINDILPGDRGAYNPEGFVLIDVAEGDSAAGHFIVDPASSSYNPQFGGVVDKGIFFYPIIYDEATQQHKLYGLPGQSAQQLPLLAHAAQGLWRNASSSWFERQTDVRDALPAAGELHGNTWIRLNDESADRDARPSVIGGGQTFTFNNDYSQDNLSLTVGRDFVIGDDDDSAWILGGLIGYSSADLEFDQSPNTANLEGMVVGIYSSYVLGGFFVDALASANFLEADFDAPSLDLFPDTAIVSTDVTTLGVQAEGGWRGLRLGSIAIEPLVGLSWAQTSFDDIKVPADDPTRLGANVKYDDPTSFRGSLGLRVSADNLSLIAPRTGLSLTARVFNEFDGEADASIENIGPQDAPVSSTLDGTFIRVNGGLSLANASGSLSGLLDVSSEFGDDYDSLGLSAGFRYQW